MLEELQTIRDAAQILSARDIEQSESLLKAGEIIWKSMYEKSAWPADCERQARALAEKLTAGDSLEAALLAVDDRRSAELARDIIEFAGAIGQENGAFV